MSPAAGVGFESVIRELQRLVRFRAQLVQRRTDTKLRIRGLLRENRPKCLAAQAWTKSWYKWLATVDLSDFDRWIINEHLEELSSVSGRMGAVDAKIKAHLKDGPVAQILLAQTGVCMVTAATMRAEIGRFDRFNSGNSSCGSVASRLATRAVALARPTRA